MSEVRWYWLLMNSITSSSLVSGEKVSLLTSPVGPLIWNSFCKKHIQPNQKKCYLHLLIGFICKVKHCLIRNLVCRAACTVWFYPPERNLAKMNIIREKYCLLPRASKQNNSQSKTSSLCEQNIYCERFGPRCHFKSRLSMIIRLDIL